jgi:hypothetical protein
VPAAPIPSKPSKKVVLANVLDNIQSERLDTGARSFQAAQLSSVPSATPVWKKVSLKRGFEELQKFWPVIESMDVVIAGGFARYCASEANPVADPGDLDIFTFTQDAFDALVGLIKACGVTKNNQTEMAITFNPGQSGLFATNRPIQVVRPVKDVSKPEDILVRFDISAVRAAILSPSEILIDRDFQSAERDKKIVFKNIISPISALYRLGKYSQKGYTASVLEILKILKVWDDLPEQDRKMMHDFLENGNSLKDFYSLLNGFNRTAKLTSPEKPTRSITLDDDPF